MGMKWETSTPKHMRGRGKPEQERRGGHEGRQKGPSGERWLGWQEPEDSGTRKAWWRDPMLPGNNFLTVALIWKPSGCPLLLWGLVPGGPGEGLGQRPLSGGRGSHRLVSHSVWMGTLGYTDIWEELDTHHEREINKPSPYSSAILSGKTLIRHLAEYIYNILPWW